MKKIIQKQIVKIIQPEIVEYTCDLCGEICGTDDNPKSTWNIRGETKHFCFSHPNSILNEL